MRLSFCEHDTCLITFALRHASFLTFEYWHINFSNIKIQRFSYSNLQPYRKPGSPPLDPQCFPSIEHIIFSSIFAIPIVNVASNPSLDIVFIAVAIEFSQHSLLVKNAPKAVNMRLSKSKCTP